MMDERRDLVDREELRVALVASLPELDQDEWDRGRRSGIAVSVALLDAMPAVEWTRGWTRDEVLAELDADPDAVCEGRGFLTGQWYAVIRPNISRWHPEVRRYDVRVRVAPEPEWVPLHEVIGRIPEGHNIAVRTVQYRRNPDGWIWDGGGEHVGSHLKVNDDGRVAVRPKAAT